MGWGALAFWLVLVCIFPRAPLALLVFLPYAEAARGPHRGSCVLDFPASRTKSQDKPFSLQITQSL